jgi:hypothetical protein
LRRREFGLLLDQGGEGEGRRKLGKGREIKGKRKEGRGEEKGEG